MKLHTMIETDVSKMNCARVHIQISNASAPFTTPIAVEFSETENWRTQKTKRRTKYVSNVGRRVGNYA